MVSQRRPAGNARFLSARLRATYCPRGRRRRPIPRALGFLKLVQIFHVAFHCCSRKQSPGQQAKGPRTEAGRPRVLPLMGVQPVSLVSGGPACSLPASATLTTGWAPCGPPRAAPALDSAWAWSREGGGGAIWPWLNCQYHCAATLGLETLGGQLQVKVPRASGVALYRLPHWEPSCPPRRCPGQGWFCGSAGFHRVRSRGIGASLPHRGAVGTQAPTPQSGTGSWDSAR